MLIRASVILAIISSSYAFQWRYINYTWASRSEYRRAINSKTYIVENNVLGGMKFYKDSLYLVNPRLLPGTPVTLSTVPIATSLEENPLLIPFPSWKMNVRPNCKTLQNVQSIEIDTKGIMWVLDGTRTNPKFTTCPPKIILFDLNKHGRIVRSVTLPNEICLHDGCFLNDLVIDESDGGYAYITDSSSIDPGLIVYSRAKNKAWKLRDRSMFAELDADNITVNGVLVQTQLGIDGIALSPIGDPNRRVFFNALNGYNLYSIRTTVLTDEALCKTNDWRRSIKYVGKKSDIGDGMIIDANGDLYFGLISKYSIAKWNVYNSIFSETIRQFDEKTFVWPDSFAVDSFNNVNVLTDEIDVAFLGLPSTTDRIRFRVWTLQTGFKNYMYPTA